MSKRSVSLAESPVEFRPQSVTGLGRDRPLEHDVAVLSPAVQPLGFRRGDDAGLQAPVDLLACIYSIRPETGEPTEVRRIGSLRRDE